MMQVGGDGGRLMEASISASHDTDTRESSVRIGVASAVVTSTARESISSWRFQDSNGNTMSATNTQLVQANGKYWIQQGSQNNAYYYEAELTIEGDQHRITAQAKNDTRVTQAMLGGTMQRVLSAPAVAIASADYQLSLDGADETTNGNLSLVHLGGYYYVEEQVSPDQYAYYRADVTIKTGGAQNTIRVVSDRNQAITVSDQPYVSGTSTAHLDPENNNVQVNYVDRAGGTHTDVMRDDGDGGYVFNVEEFINGEGANKTAKVVRGDNGSYLLQTVNGMGDIVLYYPMTSSVSTNVENNRTVVTVYEAEDSQRLRTPPNPLSAIDQTISRVDAKRGQLGALENRLESVIQGNTSTSLSLTASRSRILDADYAVEISQMTRAQIVQQASTSLLAQANQLPETVLTLLQSR
ncbi:MAG: flagellin [Symbiopectobacterium sp.]|uniref:flagellin n=1 Tax=Symbiopectobacterium sp. TaxID=2952789 RepID=UPI0039EAA859